jgi:tRNA (guanine10-N2)-dimethyltransferase
MNMLQSLVILGRQPALGLAEVESIFGSATVSVVSDQVAGLAVPASDVDFRRLGGSTRLAEVLATVQSKLWKDVEKQLARNLVEISRSLPEGKLQLGISAYGIPVTRQKLTATGLTLKKIVRGRTDRSLRLTPNNELELSTAQVLHNHLTGQTGVEFLVCASPDGKTIIARTTAVQDIDSYTVRDRSRPKRDARVGMLPPKLAQIIINLAAANVQPTESTTVLDPFCGTGVVLQEALLMGYSAYGTDLEPRMIEYSRKNIDWAIDTLKLQTTTVALEVGDATTHNWTPTPAVVAGETYLGRPFTDRPAPEVLAQTIGDVNLILKKFLQNIRAQLTPGSRLCLGVPAWQISPDRFKHLPIIDSLEEMGYNRVSFEHVRDDQLLYYRENQVVARQLLVLTVK